MVINLPVSLPEEQVDANVDTRSVENGQASGSAEEINFTLIFGIENLVQGCSDIVSIGIGETLGAASGQTCHQLGLLSDARRVVTDEDIVLALDPIGLN